MGGFAPTAVEPPEEFVSPVGPVPGARQQGLNGWDEVLGSSSHEALPPG